MRLIINEKINSYWIDTYSYIQIKVQNNGEKWDQNVDVSNKKSVLWWYYNLNS